MVKWNRLELLCYTIVEPVVTYVHVVSCIQKEKTYSTRLTHIFSHREDISYLAAAKSLRRRDVGFIGRALDSVGVERVQDIASLGIGTLYQDVSDSSEDEPFMFGDEDDDEEEEDGKAPRQITFSPSTSSKGKDKVVVIKGRDTQFRKQIVNGDMVALMGGEKDKKIMFMLKVCWLEYIFVV